MIFLLSPAKTLDYETPSHVPAQADPGFVTQSAELIQGLKKLSANELAELMELSPALAGLNVQRYRDWSRQFTEHNSKPAMLAFNGDVYEGLDAASLSAHDLAWAQQHVAILSGLYGLLRPLDRMQPYRLEMGTALPNPRGKNLYEFWGSTLAEHLNGLLSQDPSPLIVNLASQEYFKAVSRKALKVPVLECVFEDWKGSAYKVISFYAKRARGLMVRYAVTHRVRSASALQAFDSEGYAFSAEASDDKRWVFQRRLSDI
jgi:cytoplasmic iron level regulating protein YaaA (DUF328/UPF0246 family)